MTNDHFKPGWKTMQYSLLIVGMVVSIVGGIWIGQGTGVFPYPSTSFMIDQPQWALIGSALLVFGLLLIAGGRGARGDL
jgi:hypothetical protein